MLGLELTATPQVERGTASTPFKNVIYSYPLASAMHDGFVKEPAVATRENFDAANYTPDGLEQCQARRWRAYPRKHQGRAGRYTPGITISLIVKPFMLVVAQDTEHANALQQRIESDDFFEGRYRGKVITVHSNVRGEEKDEVVQQLLTVEQPDNPIEIVIHVNMLKEGWDVTNLYTIVPLRAANSRTLVEQSIGRGLRLPYGKRVGSPAIDRLTIVSHDRFQEIIDHANDPDSIIRAGVVIGKDIPDTGKKAVIVAPRLEQMLSTLRGKAGRNHCVWMQSRGLFDNPEEQAVARATLQVIRQYERLRGSAQLQHDDIQQEIVKKVEELVRPVHGLMYDMLGEERVAEVVRETAALYQEMSIDIPKIVVLPKGEVTAGYKDFDLDTRHINLQPVAQDILIQHLHDRQRYRLRDGSGIVEEKHPEDYLVRGLIDFNDISYDDHAALLYKLSGQVVAHLRTYLSSEEDVVNVLQYHQQPLVNLVHAQMQAHFVESATAYEVNVTKGFHTLRPNNYTADQNESGRDFRAPIPDGEKHRIGTMLFGGFQKCLYPLQKFDSDAERRFAVMLENDAEVLKWFKPAKGDFQIHYRSDDSYEPDFVVETHTRKFLCEPKRASELNDPDVIAKAEAASLWCQQASEHARESSGKSWIYLLIPHDQIAAQMTLAGLAARYTYQQRDTGTTSFDP